MSSQTFLDSLVEGLAGSGWGEISYNYDFEGVYPFDLHAAKRIWGSIGILRIFVTRSTGYLDNTRLREYMSLYEIVKRRAHWSWTKNRIFFLCLLSEAGVAREAASTVGRYAANPVKGSGLFLCLVDLRNLAAYMKVPTLPLIFNRACGKVLRNVNTALSATRATAPAVQPPTPTYPCPVCGSPLTFIEQYQRWYCYNCRRYA